MNNTLHLYNRDRVQVAAHRGVAGVNIPCNTIPAFDIALHGGAAILEMDLFKSLDGEIFIFHTGKEPFQLDRHIDLTRMTAEEIRKLRLINVDFNETEHGLNTFDEVLEHMKNRCILNLDRCGAFIPDVIKQVERHGMKEQILLKNAPTKEALRTVEEVAPDYMFMPIYMENDTASELIESMNINYMGAELVFSTEKAPVIQPEYIEAMHKKRTYFVGKCCPIQLQGSSFCRSHGRCFYDERPGFGMGLAGRAWLRYYPVRLDLSVL